MSWTIGNVHRGDLDRPGAVYVGRAGRGLSNSPLANPFRLDRSRPRDEQEHVLESYRRWLWRHIQTDSPQRRELARLAALPDGILVCFCAPARCHAETIRDAIDWWRTGHTRQRQTNEPRTTPGRLEDLPE